MMRADVVMAAVHPTWRSSSSPDVGRRNAKRRREGRQAATQRSFSFEELVLLLVSRIVIFFSVFVCSSHTTSSRERDFYIEPRFVYLRVHWLPARVYGSLQSTGTYPFKTMDAKLDAEVLVKLIKLEINVSEY
jgi:hypothetical protein